MQFKRTVIALSLLFAYSLGFAHELIPHCHHNEGVAVLGEESATHSHEHEHEHHHHDQSQESEEHEHDHVQHQDHFDDGLMDFIICVLTAAEHPSSDADHCYQMPATTNAIKFTAWDKIKLIATFTAVFAEPVEEASADLLVPDADVAFLSPPLANSTDRGPPSFFCPFA
jgi:hypothetical protein